MDYEDLTGRNFGVFTVVGLKNIKREPQWICKCNKCGRTHVYSSYRLLNYNEFKNIECRFCKRYPSVEDVLSRRSMLQRWYKIKGRCLDPNDPAYKYYGGRGIFICDEWKNDFEAFYSYIKGLEHYDEPGRSIDRINNDDGYRPGNIRWATAKEQANNQRRRKSAKSKRESQTKENSL